MAKWPKRNANACEFLESIGIDPARILDGSINGAGYDVILLDDGGKRITRAYDGAQTEFVAWENPESDYAGYRRARSLDWGGDED